MNSELATQNSQTAVLYQPEAGVGGLPMVGHVARPQNRGWYYVALIVGAVVVGGGAFGVVGLLQSHGVISVSHAVAAAIGKVGATPHFWSLWTLAVGGVVAGGGTIFISAYKLCKVDNPVETPEGPLDNPVETPEGPLDNPVETPEGPLDNPVETLEAPSHVAFQPYFPSNYTYDGTLPTVRELGSGVFCVESLDSSFQILRRPHSSEDQPLRNLEISNLLSLEQLMLAKQELSDYREWIPADLSARQPSNPAFSNVFNPYDDVGWNIGGSRWGEG